MKKLLFAVVIALAASSGASGGARSAPWGSYVGTAKGTDAFVAVLVGKRVTGGRQQVLGYVCDSKRIAEWFHGTTTGPAFTVRSSAGATLTVTVASGHATGTFTLAGAAHSFTAPLAKRPAGLYHGQKTTHGKHYLGGWIILPDHRQRGAVKTGSTITASPPLTGFITPIGGF